MLTASIAIGGVATLIAAWLAWARLVQTETVHVGDHCRGGLLANG
jgi:hypothetical protein